MSRRSVNPALEFVFDEFVNSPDPFDLQPTIAALETLAVELRQSIENTNWEKRVGYYRDQAMTIARHIIDSEVMEAKIPDNLERLDFAKEMAKSIFPLVRECFDMHMGSNTTISPDQAKVMATLIESKGKMVERYKKLAESTQVNLQWDQQLIEFMLQMVAQVVIPNVTSMEDRIRVAKAAKAFFPNLKAPAQLASGQ